MALDGLGSDDIEVDGVMSRPSDPMPCERKCSGVFAPIVFSTRKSFWEKILGNGVRSMRSVRSVVFIDRISSRFIPFIPFTPLRVRRARLFLFEKQKPTEKTIGGLPL